MANNYYLPSYSGEISTSSSDNVYEEKAPLNYYYSPRLFGAPPQLTNQCDMRILSSRGGSSPQPGPVGDYYMECILKDAQVANIIVGHALFNGGYHTYKSLLRSAYAYGYALKNFNVFNDSGTSVKNMSAVTESISTYEKSLGTDVDDRSGTMGVVNEDGTATTVNSEATTSAAQTELNTNIQTESTTGTSGVSDATYSLDVSSIEGANTIIEGIANMFGATGIAGGMSGLTTWVSAAHSMQQSFYTFEADWSSYIDNVRMMINSAIVMLGLNTAKVRIGEDLLPIKATVKLKETDVWSNYRYITPTENNKVGNVNNINTLTGDTNQYVSFMIEPTSIQENYSNQTGPSQIYGNVIQTGETLGNEIAFLSNTSRSSIDDSLINLANTGINYAERIIQNLTLGSGKFTAAILGSMARSYTGDHTIFPEIFTSHTSTSNVTLNIKLRASAGDPYTYLMEILVPIFHLMAMAIPQMSKSAASAYSYPPLVQVNIPGVWGTRLGIIETLSVAKSGTDFSVNGYPLAVDVSVVVKDLQHVIMSSGMSKKAQMLNNDTMFDYIAQCAGVDKYRYNPAIRVVTKLILGAAQGMNSLYNLGVAVLNAGTARVNRFTGNT